WLSPVTRLALSAVASLETSGCKSCHAFVRIREVTPADGLGIKLFAVDLRRSACASRGASGLRGASLLGAHTKDWLHELVSVGNGDFAETCYFEHFVHIVFVDISFRKIQ